MQEYYHRKYIKYKLKYFRLVQKGGNEYTRNICDERNKISLKQLNVGDRIHFIIRSRDTATNTDINLSIDFTVEAHASGTGNILVSDLKSLGPDGRLKEDPALVLYYVPGHENKQIKINFIRTPQNTDRFDFKKLMYISSCIAKYFNCTEVLLHDDANFSKLYRGGPVDYKALLYRTIAENKKSIYDNYGFKHDANHEHTRNDVFPPPYRYTEDQYNMDRACFNDLTIGGVIEYIKITIGYMRERRSNPVRITILNELVTEFSAMDPQTKFRNIVHELADHNTTVERVKKINELLIALQTKPQFQELYDYLARNMCVGAMRRIMLSHEHMKLINIQCKYCQ